MEQRYSSVPIVFEIFEYFCSSPLCICSYHRGESVFPHRTEDALDIFAPGKYATLLLTLSRACRSITSEDSAVAVTSSAAAPFFPRSLGGGGGGGERDSFFFCLQPVIRWKRRGGARLHCSPRDGRRDWKEKSKSAKRVDA